MKQRFKKLLAIVLSAAMCLPMLSADLVKAENDGGIIWTDPETISVTPL